METPPVNVSSSKGGGRVFLILTSYISSAPTNFLSTSVISYKFNPERLFKGSMLRFLNS